MVDQHVWRTEAILHVGHDAFPICPGGHIMIQKDGIVPGDPDAVL